MYCDEVSSVELSILTSSTSEEEVSTVDSLDVCSELEEDSTDSDSDSDSVLSFCSSASID